MKEQRRIHLLLLPASIGIMASLVLLSLLPEFAEAARLKNIAGSMSDSYQTMRQAKMVSLYGGVFFVAAGVGIFLGKKKLEVSAMLPTLLLLLGTSLLVFHYS